MTVNYYDKENKIAYSFDKLIILGVKGGYEYIQKRRKTAFTDLKARAIIYGFKQYIETLYSFFEHELNDYYETGSDVFKNRIIELISNDYEEGTLEDGIKTILLSKLDGVYKVSDTMIYQMT